MHLLGIASEAAFGRTIESQQLKILADSFCPNENHRQQAAPRDYDGGNRKRLPQPLKSESNKRHWEELRFQEIKSGPKSRMELFAAHCREHKGSKTEQDHQRSLPLEENAMDTKVAKRAE